MVCWFMTYIRIDWRCQLFSDTSGFTENGGTFWSLNGIHGIFSLCYWNLILNNMTPHVRLQLRVPRPCYNNKFAMKEACKCRFDRLVFFLSFLGDSKDHIFILNSIFVNGSLAYIVKAFFSNDLVPSTWLKRNDLKTVMANLKLNYFETMMWKVDIWADIVIRMSFLIE